MTLKLRPKPIVSKGLIVDMSKIDLPPTYKSKHIIRGPRLLSHCTITYFSRVSCLNFNHVIIKKDFHNVVAFYGRSKHKEVKC